MKFRLLCQIEYWRRYNGTANLHFKNILTQPMHAENWDEVIMVVSNVSVGENTLDMGNKAQFACRGADPSKHVVRVMQIIVEE